MQKHKYVLWSSLIVAGCALILLLGRVVYYMNDAKLVYRPGTLEPTSQAQVEKINADATAYLASSKLPYSYYFEPLVDSNAQSTGHSAGTQTVRSASLLKVVVAMGLYKLAEQHEADMDQRMVLEQSWLDNSYGQLWQRGAGATITLQDAVRLSLVNSDNTALNVLHFAVAKYGGDEHEAARATHFQYQEDAQHHSYTTAQNYASVLKCLYRTCYLTKTDSSNILEMLTETSFDGIVDGVPKNVKVAHKIGETETSYADCGIIYNRNRPYILCVMLGAPCPSALPVMTQVSKIVYNGMR